MAHRSAGAERVWPLSFAQERLWFVEQWNPGPVYHVPWVLRLSGPLDRQALTGAVNLVVARHGSLRTSFPDRDGRPEQRVHQPRNVEVRLRRAKSVAQAIRLAEENGCVPFDLAHTPAFRCELYQVAQDEHLLAITLHHIVCDGWSLQVMAAELSAAYNALRRGRQPDVPELSLSYAGYSEAQRASISEEDLLDNPYVVGLRDMTPLEIPADRPRPRVPSFEGRTVRRTLSMLTGQVAGFARASRTTPFAVLLAGLQTVVARYTGQSDIPIGVVLAGRDQRPELEAMIGFFANLAVVRADLSGRPSFADAVRHAGEQTWEAAAHQHVPFDLVVQHLRPHREAGRNPLVQIAVSMDPPGATGALFDGLLAEPVDLHIPGARFDLTITFAENDDEIVANAEYSTDLFDSENVERMLAHVERVVSDGIAHPDRPVHELGMVSDEERAELIRAGTGVRCEWKGDTAASWAFRQWVERTPDAVAVRWRNETVSYSQLDRRVAALMAMLRDECVEPGAAVAIHLPRGPEHVYALMAVHGCGATAVPMDHALPAGRIRHVLKDSAAELVLTTADLHDRLPQDVDTRTVLVDTVGTGDHTTSPIPVRARDRATILYTSGSTGEPKGVVLEHGAISEFVTGVAGRLGMTPADRVLRFCSPMFDVTMLEIFPAFAAGASVVFPEDAEVADPARLTALLRREKVTVAAIPPPLQPLLSPDELPDLRVQMSAGEVMPGAEATRWQAPGRLVLNVYGPSETTIAKTVHECRGTYRTPPPIGGPLPNARLYVLDQSLNLVPRGVPGELYIGGPGVSPGYLGRPGMTADRHRPDPFGPVGQRMYRSGDIVRLRADGELDFLGRQDDQVKVRGFRIELGDVEAALRSYPGVSAAVAAVRASPDGTAQLVGYVVGEVDEAGLRAHLAEEVPYYMVPAAIVRMTEFPHTVSGKIDRKRLPDPEGVPRHGRPPDTEVQEQVARIFAETLGHEVTDVDRPFFQFGGSSIQAVTLVRRLARHFGDSLPADVDVAWFYTHSTVADVAAAVRSDRLSEGPDSLVPLAGGDRRPLYLIHPTTGSAACYGPLARELDGTIPVVGVQLASAEIIDLAGLAGRYAKLIQAHSPGPYRIGGWSVGGLLAFAVARQLLAEGAQVETVVVLDSVFLDTDEGWSDEELCADFLAHFVRQVTGSVPDAPLESMPCDEQIRHVLRQVPAAGVDAEFLRARAAVASGILRACRGYRPEYPGRVVLVRAADSADTSWDFSEVVSGELVDVVLAGEHHTVLDNDHAGPLADVVKEVLP